MREMKRLYNVSNSHHMNDDGHGLGCREEDMRAAPRGGVGFVGLGSRTVLDEAAAALGKDIEPLLNFDCSIMSIAEAGKRDGYTHAHAHAHARTHAHTHKHICE